MNSTANWPLFATSAPIDSRIDLIGQQNNFSKLMAQCNTSNDFNEKPDDLSSHLNKHLQNQSLNQNLNQNQNQNPFNHLKNGVNNNIINEQNIKTNNNSNNSNTGSSDATNGEVLNLRIDDSREDEFDDSDSLIDSIGDDDDSLPSPDAMYATSYLSNDSNERNGIHDDTNKDDIGSEGQSIGEQSPIGPLAQLQNALERHSGMLGMSLTDFAPTNGTGPSLFGFGGNAIGAMATAFNVDNDITGELYRCHLCSYSGTSKCQFNAHMNTHFDHKCPFCDYKSRTEGRLKRHIRDFHSEVPPESWAGNRVLKENSRDEGEESVDATDASVNGSGGHSKNRKYKCKQCEFVATCKQEFWDHSKAHIKSEKLLTCPKCNFVTEYKHHLEYHLRNHFGSKPFKCAKCNYSCVNKSMLNSHMKSHSNIYQYRCADCSYATKYCHSLKLHLRKYQHKPATVLNLDGTPNPYPVIDVYGTRRGPRPKKSKTPKCSQNNQKSQQVESSLPQTPIMSSPLSPNMMNSTPIPPLIPTSMPMGLPFMYPPNPGLLHTGLLGPQIPHLNAMSHSLYDSPTIANMSLNSPNSNANPQTHSNHSAPNSNSKLKCNFCDFCADTRELFGKHLLLHVAAENQDICKMYGMTPSAEMLQQNAIIGELAARQSPDSRRLLEQIAVNPSFINTLLGMHSLPKPEHLMALDWHSAQDSIVDQRRHALSPEPILALTDGRENRPESAPIRPNSKGSVSPLPRSRSSPTDAFDSFATDRTQTNLKSKQLSSDTTPLDLSSNKSSSPLTQPFEAKISILTQQLTQTLPPNEESVKQTEAQSVPTVAPSAGPAPAQEALPEQQQSRAQRRKGRASKLNVNRCVKMDDQSLKCDDMDEDMSEDTADSLPEEPDVDHIITKINNATNLLQEILIDMYSLKNDAYH